MVLVRDKGFLNGEFGNQTEFLEDGGNSPRSRQARREARKRLAGEEEGAFVPAEGPGDDVDEGGLSRTVFAEENMHFARHQVEVHVLERDRTGKSLRDSDQLQQFYV